MAITIIIVQCIVVNPIKIWLEVEEPKEPADIKGLAVQDLTKNPHTTLKEKNLILTLTIKAVILWHIAHKLKLIIIILVKACTEDLNLDLIWVIVQVIIQEPKNIIQEKADSSELLNIVIPMIIDPLKNINNNSPWVMKIKFII